MKIRDRLQHLSPTLLSRFTVVESKAHSLLEYAQGGTHLTFTPHGLSHISKVESNYDWLLSDEDVALFNETELFVLLCATVFHDAFMIPKFTGDESEARAKHVQRAGDYLSKNHSSISLQRNEAHAVSEVIRGHAVQFIEQLGKPIAIGAQLVDLQKLGACLSLADLCHADESRAPQIVFEHLTLDEESDFHWRRHLQISGTVRDGNNILISALIFSPDGREAVNGYRLAVEAQLKAVRPYFETKLTPILKVDLQITELVSALEQVFKFQANMPAILSLLIEGVYQRSDVFIRELIQNSLDACLLRHAKSIRRNEPYSPSILITILRGENGNPAAIRVDDNGIGMDINDIKDTLLWIGSSIAAKDTVKALLSETVRKNLIATFGIGLLSCFKLAKSIQIRTKKESGRGIGLVINGIGDSITPNESSDHNIGTTIVVELNDDAQGSIDVDEAITYYFRRLHQAEFRQLVLEWSPKSASLSRSDILAIARTESDEIDQFPYPAQDSTITSMEIRGDDFIGRVWLGIGQKDNVNALLDVDGNLDILSEGIYVTTVESSNWLPSWMSSYQGFVDFAAKAVDLPASRDSVKENKKLETIKRKLEEKCWALVSQLVQDSSDPKRRKFMVILLADMYDRADTQQKTRMLKLIGQLHVLPFQQKTPLILAQVCAAKPNNAYLEYFQGRTVSPLSTLDGKQLWHKEDDFTRLQAAVLAQSGELVLSTERGDGESRVVLEANLLHAYFKSHGITAIKLIETNVIEGKLRSKPLRKDIRELLGSEIKFVEVPGLMNRRAWQVGKEIWVNIENPTMLKVYEKLQAGNISVETGLLLQLLFDVLSFQLDNATRGILRLLEV